MCQRPRFSTGRTSADRIGPAKFAGDPTSQLTKPPVSGPASKGHKIDFSARRFGATLWVDLRDRIGSGKKHKLRQIPMADDGSAGVLVCRPLLRRLRTQPGHHARSALGQKPTYWTRSTASPQLTTSSALISIAAGIVNPSDSKVVLLITRRKRVGCSNGRSAGCAPFKIRSARSAARS